MKSLKRAFEDYYDNKPVFKATCLIYKIQLSTILTWKDLINIKPNSLYHVYIGPNKLNWDYDLFEKIHPLFVTIQDLCIPEHNKQHILMLTISTLRYQLPSMRMFNAIIIGVGASGRSHTAITLSKYYSTMLSFEEKLITEKDEFKAVKSDKSHVIIVNHHSMLSSIVFDNIEWVRIKNDKNVFIYVKYNCPANDIPEDLHCVENFGSIIHMKLKPCNIFHIMLSKLFPACKFTIDGAELKELLSKFTITMTGTSETFSANFNDIKLLLETARMLTYNLDDEYWLTKDVLESALAHRAANIIRKNKNIIHNLYS